jgi:hypothetical protein
LFRFIFRENINHQLWVPMAHSRINSTERIWFEGPLPHIDSLSQTPGFQRMSPSCCFEFLDCDLEGISTREDWAPANHHCVIPPKAFNSSIHRYYHVSMFESIW